MADVEVLYNRDDTLTSTSGAQSDANQARIIGSTFTTSDEYLCIATQDLGGASTSGNIYDSIVAFPDSTTAFYLAQNWEPYSTSDTILHRHGLFRKITSDGTSDFETFVGQGGSSTAHKRNSAIMAINLSDLVENTDYWIEERSGSYQTDASFAIPFGASEDEPSITFTPVAGEDYLILGCFRIDQVNAGKTTNSKIDMTGGNTDSWIHSQEGEDGNAEWSIVMQGGIAGATATSTTVNLQISESSAGGSDPICLEANIFILRLNAFADHAAIIGSGFFSHTASDTYEELTTITNKPTSNGDQVFFGYFVSRGNIGILHRGRVTVDGTTLSDPLSDIDKFDNNDNYGYLTFGMVNVDAADAGVIDLDGRVSDDSGSNESADDNLVAFTVALAGDPPAATTVGSQVMMVT